MKGVSDLIKSHEREMARPSVSAGFRFVHREMISFLQHERLVHLLVTLAVIFFMLVFFVLFIFLQQLLYLGLFVILAVLTLFYVFHYFKLENTVIRWYFFFIHSLNGARSKGTSRKKS